MRKECAKISIYPGGIVMNEKIRASKTAEELIAIAKGNHIIVTERKAKEIIEQLRTDPELKTEELFSLPKDCTVDGCCPHCKSRDIWLVCRHNGNEYYCGSCGQYLTSNK